MSKRTVMIIGIAVFAAILVEEIRVYRFTKEAERRFNDQSIRLASLTERLELLES